MLTDAIATPAPRLQVPTLLVNYTHECLNVNVDFLGTEVAGLSTADAKNRITSHAVSEGTLWPPKSTRHVVVDAQGAENPVEMLSPLIWIPAPAPSVAL